MPRLILTFVVCSLFVSGLLFATQIAWRPWVSPNYAARLLADDDGKGYAFWIGDAARYWGHDIYQPLYDFTGGYSHLRSPAVFTLFDILKSDEPTNVSSVYTRLLNAQSREARILGCYATMKHALPVNRSISCMSEVREVLAQNVDMTNQSEIALALRIVSDLRMPGMRNLVIRQMTAADSPFWVRREACKAADNILESNEAAALLNSVAACVAQ